MGLTPLTLAAAQTHARTEPDVGWLAPMRQALGSDGVLAGLADRIAYGRDRMPAMSYHYRDGQILGTLPRAIALPRTEAEVCRVMEIAADHTVPVVPYGAGSGVLGGAVSLQEHGLTLDLKALNQIVEINETNLTVTVQAGMNGGTFEERLNARGVTTGHLPQSLTMSTVGGWVACRGGGQFSSRYGKIEDMVLGLRAVLPDGRVLVVNPVARRSVGPSLTDILVGSEGVFGVITEVTLRLWRLPEHEIGAVLAFPSHETGLSALREIMQAGLRPTMARLYDASESVPRAGHLEGYTDGAALCMMLFSGLKDLAEVEHRVALGIATAHGAVSLPEDPITHWRGVRYRSYSNEYMFDGAFMDTIEITGGWDALPEMYRRMKAGVEALHPEAHFGCHWSHVYPDGSCQYMTFRFPPMPLDEGKALHRAAWDVVQGACLDLNGTIAHHHGSGFWRNPWLERELSVGLDLLRGIKDRVDPDRRMNAGKLAL